MTSNYSIGIFYATISKRTERVAQEIAEGLLLDPFDVHNIIDLDDLEILTEYSILILGTPTYGKGDVHYIWKEILKEMTKLDLKEKKTALFCLGDQKHHAPTFAGGLIKMYDQLKQQGCTIIGHCDAAKYDFKTSSSVIEGNLFPGLVLDEVNEAHLTQERIDTWIQQLRKYWF